MAILKHIKSRNANYSNAIDYLLFQHDESTGKKIKDEMGRSLLRDEFFASSFVSPSRSKSGNKLFLNVSGKSILKKSKMFL